MSRHHHDIFYNSYKFPLKKKKEICDWAKERCFHWHVDELSGMQRKQIEMSYEDIMNKLDDKSHFVVIHRRGFENMRGKPREYMGEWCLEVGFRTFSLGIEHFLWIYCKEELVEELINKFEIKPL